MFSAFSIDSVTFSITSLPMAFSFPTLSICDVSVAFSVSPSSPVSLIRLNEATSFPAPSIKVVNCASGTLRIFF